MFALLLALALAQDAEALARQWTEAIRKINEEHAAAPGKAKEPDLAKRVTQSMTARLDRLVALPNASSASLIEAGEACLDLDLMPQFEKIRGRLTKEDAAKLGSALSRDRYILRGIGIEKEYLEKFAGVMDAVLAAYDEVFGFEEFSKVPGKKLRVRIHLEEEIKRPPHFAPQFPFHSEIDFPVIDPKELTSPTSKGHFLFYGLCHELGHVIAMWGDRTNEEDHHAWAHYTGVVIVGHLAKSKNPALAGLKDAKWRSFDLERKNLKAAPSLADRDGVMSLLVVLHDKVGPKAIGTAINLLDREDRRRRINKVRYYGFAELKDALLRTLKDPKARTAVAELIR
ncbi:MAG TPA: hypothetical protein VJU16_06485 [Planctomycetota bacterium]|nr:hypothetical protein [Planctomycetota bacterium]